MSEQDAGIPARQGEKMIAVTVYFWTNNIASVKDNIQPKQCHSAGIAMLRANKSHGIGSSARRYIFRSVEELPNVINEAMEDTGVKMH